MDFPMNKQQILQLVEQTMATLHFFVDIKEDDSGINMSYNFIHHYVGIDVERIQEAIHELTFPVSLDAYIQAFTMHELGHAMDREALLVALPKMIDVFEMKREHSLYEQYNTIDFLSMIIDEREMNLTFEETAWNNAAQMNEQHQLVDWDTFHQLKTHSLATYRKYYQRDLEIYQNLLAKVRKLSA